MPTHLTPRKARPANVVNGVDWAAYLQLRDHPGNSDLRLTLDGTLILVSPQSLHDLNGRRLGMVVDLVTEALETLIQGTVTTTLRRSGPGHLKGSVKEPDQGFYFGPNAIRMQKKEQFDLEFDPPPDLVIELDNKSDSSRTLKVYSRLGVAEFWRYRVRSRNLWLCKLIGDKYEAIDRSLHLPRLSADAILFAMAKIDELGETAPKPWLREWARTLPEPLG